MRGGGRIFNLFDPLFVNCGVTEGFDTISYVHITGITIDRDSGRTLTDQLADSLRSAIRLGKWMAGDRLPTCRELMAECNVSRNVVQIAVRRLVAEGLVVVRPHLGCIVARTSKRAARGVVLEIDTSSGVPYKNACFSAAFHRALSEDRIDCRRVVLSYDSRDKMIRFDRERLEHELAKRPDVALVSASLSRRSSVQRMMDAHDIPYIMVDSAVPGRHPRMLWSGKCDMEPDMGGFVDDCVRAGIRSVMWLAHSEKSGFNPCTALERAGIAVERLFAWRKSIGYDIGLRQFVELGRDCMIERMKKGPLCDLLFVADDHLALGAIPVLLEGGVRIPEDLKLVTQYNKGFGLVLTKSLSRIECDPAATAVEYAHGIVEWIRTGRFPELKAPVSSYVRGDTFPVPASQQYSDVEHKDKGPML